MAENPRLAPTLFCVKCFADERSASWSGLVIWNHCLNCGAGGTVVVLAAWAIDSIRQSASWVGKRYYPDDEDVEAHAEKRALRRQMTTFHGRTAREVEPGRWAVVQQMSSNKTISVSVDADSREQALDRAVELLPWVPEPQPAPAAAHETVHVL